MSEEQTLMEQLIFDLLDRRIEEIVTNAMPTHKVFEGTDHETLISDGNMAYYQSRKQTAEYLLERYTIVPKPGRNLNDSWIDYNEAWKDAWERYPDNTDLHAAMRSIQMQRFYDSLTSKNDKTTI